MSERKRVVIGVDIGGTKIAAHLSDGTLWSMGETTRPTPPQAQPAALQNAPQDRQQVEQAGREALLDAVISLCQTMQAAHEREVEVIGVGIGSAGQVDATSGTMLDAVENLVGWAGTPVSERVGAALGLPVFIDNDVRAMALAETRLGAAQAYRHVLCLTVGTGIGSAIVLDGALWHGAHASAGEIGYLYSRPAAQGWHTIEQDYAGPGIEREYQRVAQSERRLSLREIAALAHEADDAHARTTIRNLAHGLGTKLAPVLCFLDPEAVVVGGGVPQIGALWWQHFVGGIRDFHIGTVQQMPIIPAALGPRAGMIGAGLLAWQRVNNSA